MKTRLLLLLTVAALTGWAAHARAAVYNASLYGVTFSYGGPIPDGSHFTVDTTAHTVTDVNLSTPSVLVNGKTIPAYSYAYASTYSDFTPSDGFNGPGKFLLGFLPTVPANTTLTLQFQQTADGLSLVTGPTSQSFQDFGTDGFRPVTAATVAVPEPTALAAIATAALLGLRRPRRPSRHEPEA